MQENPIVKKGNKYINHPTIVKNTCNNNNCENKVCTPENSINCSDIIERKHVGHVTHSSEKGEHVSDVDFNNKSKAQYYKPYNNPVTVETHELNNKNALRSETLQKDKDTLCIIHVITNEKKNE